MQMIYRVIAILLIALSATAVSFADTVKEASTNKHLSSQVNVYNQTGYVYTVNVTYVGQYGVTRKYAMTLNTGSSIQFPIALPEYAIYLEIIRNADGYVTYTGYVSSDDIYIRNGLSDKMPSASVNHR